MLLSMFISFLLARRFRWRIYVVLVAVIVALVSLFSVTVVSVYPLTFVYETRGRPLPLSFPFHVLIGMSIPITGPATYNCRIYFLTLEIGFQDMPPYSQSRRIPPPPSIDYLISFLGNIYLPFLLINLVGALLGYWISKCARAWDVLVVTLGGSFMIMGIALFYIPIVDYYGRVRYGLSGPYGVDGLALFLFGIIVLAIVIGKILLRFQIRDIENPEVNE